jgi:hypothetical protein
LRKRRTLDQPQYAAAGLQSVARRLRIAATQSAGAITGELHRSKNAVWICSILDSIPLTISVKDEALYLHDCGDHHDERLEIYDF